MTDDTMTMADGEEVKRFNTKKKPIKFYLDDDLLTAAPKIPADTMISLMDKHKTLREAAENKSRGGLTIAMNMFEEVLFEESMGIIHSRMKDRENPLDLMDVLDVFNWLMGRYGLRPTKSASSSSEESEDSTASDGDGTTSTDGAPHEESTPENSSGTDSSTSAITGSVED